MEFRELILNRLKTDKELLKQKFNESKAKVGTRHFVVDDLLPQEVAMDLYEKFPGYEQMRLMKSFREHKATYKQTKNIDPLVTECLMSFQHPEIVKVVEEITGIKNQVSDPTFYAGGLSLMNPGDFLNPHIDNSHDKDRKHYRTINLLYYITPDWKEEDGGNLELWDPKVKDKVTIYSRFNRLAIMETTHLSWHSVSPVKKGLDRGRACISNYYFSKTPPGKRDEYFHITAFMPRPEEGGRIKYQVDNFLRNSLRKVRKLGFGKEDLNQ
jgi:Rps23 Pro-64 3,4-dihydroxylase Tpa1-like proline 4-hydroxylase